MNTIQNKKVMVRDDYSYLFKTAEVITPLLKGEIGSVDQADIHLQHAHQEVVKQLYQYWKVEHPEAGAAYWLTESWIMLLWQPIQLAFVSIYTTQAVPKLRHIGQYYNNGLVAGYILPEEPMVTGELTQLVAYAGQELSILFNGLHQQFSGVARFTFRFAEQLLADLILINLLKLQKHKPSIDIYQQAQHWFSALAIPAQYLDSLYKESNDKLWSVKRVSCCMYYRRGDGDFCLACPNK